jgi:hypothetical protein
MCACFVTVKITDGSNVIKITFFSFDISCRFLFFFSLSLDQERLNLTDSFPSSSKLLLSTSISNGNIRHPIKPRTMAQVPIPTEQSSLDLSSDGDITIIEKRKILNHL